MTTFLFAQGMEPVALDDDESFNKARQRGNDVLTEDQDKPLHTLSFKTAEGGRIAINPDKFIGVGSDEPKDTGSGE